MPQKITPFLWFEGQAEQAANYYVGLFQDGRIERVLRWQEDGPGHRRGDVLVVDFLIEGLRFSALNGNAQFPFTPAVSLLVEVPSQAALDHVWDTMVADGGAPMACGWITDRFGVTWQIVPDTLLGYLSDPDSAPAKRAMDAMMGMVKLDFAALKKAHDGG